MTKADDIIQREIIIGTIRISNVGTTLEMIGINVNIMEVIEETLRIETSHMIEVEAG